MGELDLDAIVLGAGPAGLAAATRLARFGRRVQVWTRPRAKAPAVGESIGPEVRELLAAHGIADGFDEIPCTTFVGTKIAWGTPDPYETSGILNPLGLGRHLDRDAFDSWMLRSAQRADVEVRVAKGSLQAREAKGGWFVRDEKTSASAPFLIDARGRNHPTNGPKRTWIKFDRLIGIAAWTRTKASSGEQTSAELLVETTENGWWYSAQLPNGVLVATFMTDSDLLGGRKPLQVWRDSLGSARLTHGRVGEGGLLDLQVRRADSGYSFPDKGTNWIAIGDAGKATDPLAGAGIRNALKSALSAAESIHDGCVTPFPASHLKYLETRNRYYSQERRWPESKFWLRRTGINMEGFQCSLSPEALLWSGQGASDLDMARAESLLPYRQIGELMKFLKTPTQAHCAAEYLRSRLGSIDDGLIIASLQFLSNCGALYVRG